MEHTPYASALADLVASTRVPAAVIDWALESIQAVSGRAAAAWLYLADVATRGHAIVPLNALETFLGVSAAEADETLGQLASAFLASTWTVDGVVSATLSQRSAGLLNLRLDSTRGFAGVWVPADQPERPARRRSKLALATDLGIRIDQIARDNAEPFQHATATESLEAELTRLSKTRRLRDVDALKLPRPRVLLEGCATVWQESTVGVCSACKNRRLKTWCYCLRCDRYWLDNLLALVRKREKTNKPKKPRPRTLAERRFPERNAS